MALADPAGRQQAQHRDAARRAEHSGDDVDRPRFRPCQHRLLVLPRRLFLTSRRRLRRPPLPRRRRMSRSLRARR